LRFLRFLRFSWARKNEEDDDDDAEKRGAPAIALCFFLFLLSVFRVFPPGENSRHATEASIHGVPRNAL
jgi:hypothetical protein